MTLPKFNIREGTLDEVIRVSGNIPEFINPYDKQEYVCRIASKKHLILIAESNHQLVGFKLGYQLDSKVFYSWFGGVIASHRKMGIATALARQQEKWAASLGFKWIRVKTRNSFTPMLLFAIGSGFQILDLEKKEQIGEYRILLEKEL